MQGSEGMVKLAVLGLMLGMFMPSFGQKVDKAGLADDKYNLDETVEDKAEARKEKDSKAEMQYIVTEEVYFDMYIGNKTTKKKPVEDRVVIACFGEITPITCLNFVALAKGHRKGRKLLTYKGTLVHRIVRDFVVQMGDVTGKKGMSGTSIYGDSFHDENFQLSHKGTGWVSMANHGRDTNGSQFFVMLHPARWLDGKHVVFGKVIKGMDIIRKIGELDTTVTGRPKENVYIKDSGVIGIDRKYQISKENI